MTCWRKRERGGGGGGMRGGEGIGERGRERKLKNYLQSSYSKDISLTCAYLTADGNILLKCVQFFTAIGTCVVLRAPVRYG